jgi:7-carboxy-7-deazaguanine synthase
MKKYAVHSIFDTIQGEGSHAGKAALFVRFTGCNVWNGDHGTRLESAKRNSECANFCDTEFKGHNLSKHGRVYNAEELVRQMREVVTRSRGPARKYERVIAVITGGEPSLQLDRTLVDAMHADHFAVHVETNGTNVVPSNVDWLTLSPKPPMPVVYPRSLPNAKLYDEVKLLSCFLGYASQASTHASKLYVQPVDYGPLTSSKSEIEKCVKFVRENPTWRISAQLHKHWGIE